MTESELIDYLLQTRPSKLKHHSNLTHFKNMKTKCGDVLCDINYACNDVNISYQHSHPINHHNKHQTSHCVTQTSLNKHMK